MPATSTTVFTDGACSGNPGPGGWAWAVPGGRWRSGVEARSTNQRMEIHAALDAVLSLPGPLEVVSDSTYVVNCFRDRWWEGWLARGWVNKSRKPVANRDLWEPLIEAVRAEPGRVRFRWVKGHGGDAMNDLVDRLAVEAARRQVGDEGDGPPATLGPPDTVGRRAGPAGPAGSAGSAALRAGPAGPDGDRQGAGPGAGNASGERDPRLPAGRLITVAGMRPDALGGWDDNPVAAGVRRSLVAILEAKRQLHGDCSVLTGMGLGAELLGAEAAVAAGVPLVAVLAFPGHERPWPAARRAQFRELLDQAAAVVTLQSRAPDGRPAVGAALRRRDEFMARQADEAVVVWDGAEPLTGRLVRSLQDHLGEEDVWVVAPAG